MAGKHVNALTRLDQLFKEVGAKGVGRNQHRKLCEAYLAGRRSEGQADCLASVFSDSWSKNSERALIDQPFVRSSTLKKRKPLSADSRGANKVSYLLSRRQHQKGSIPVSSGPTGYRFKWLNREIPPFRQERSGDRFSGAGGIDYTGVSISRHEHLVLGEIKYRSGKSLDRNAFYAFVQLLWYLSRMATRNQIERAAMFPSVECGGFGVSPSWPQRFDLHILLVDQHLLPASTQEAHRELSELTCKLAKKLRSELPDNVAGVLGSILCLQMDSAAFARKRDSLHCDWCVS